LKEAIKRADDAAAQAMMLIKNYITKVNKVITTEIPQ
jgi:hypothetical protein